MESTGKRQLQCWQVNLHHSHAASYNMESTVGRMQMNRVVMVHEQMSEASFQLLVMHRERCQGVYLYLKKPGGRGSGNLQHAAEKMWWL